MNQQTTFESFDFEILRTACSLQLIEKKERECMFDTLTLVLLLLLQQHFLNCFQCCAHINIIYFCVENKSPKTGAKTKREKILLWRRIAVQIFRYGREKLMHSMA
jgi:hypothetical protein